MSDSSMRLSAATCYTSATQTEIYFIMATNRETTLEKQIEETKKTLVALGDMRPGSLSKQYNVCGKPGCSCKADPPKKHGPYYQVSYTRKGKSSVCAPLTPPSHAWRHADIVWAMDRSIGWTGQPG